MRILNMTPHAIVLRSQEGDVSLPPSGVVARVSSTPGALRQVEGVPVPVADPQTWGEVVGLPSPEEGTLLVVSSLVLGALRGSRQDVVAPGTGPGDAPVRDEQGRVVAVTRLVRG